MASDIPYLKILNIIVKRDRQFTLIFLSLLPEATQVPSGWNFTLFTTLVWSVNVCTRLFCERSQSFTVRSSEPDTMTLASGENWASRIQLVWAWIDSWKRLSAICQTLRVLSSDAVRRSWPSHENVEVLTGAEWDLKTW